VRMCFHFDNKVYLRQKNSVSIYKIIVLFIGVFQ